ncbi:MAG: integrase arm-type DNA-binding domain-containing protein [Pseudomonadota bacterium]
MKTLTDRGIRALKARGYPYRIFDKQTKGLHIQVTKNGQHNWCLRYEHAGQRRFMKIGTYPATSIADARRRATESLGKAEAGIDPATEGTRGQEIPTVESMLRAYLAERTDSGVKTVYFIEQAFDKNVLPYIGDRKCPEITADDITILLRRIIQRGSKTMARRVQQFLHAAFEYGVKANNNPNILERGVNYGLNGVNPVTATQIVKIGRRAENHYPSMEELAIAWHKIAEHSGPEMTGALRFHIAMGGQRVTETLFARWDWLQNVNGHPCLCVPDTKTGIPHTIPLGQHAQAVIAEMRQHTGNCEVIFPQRNAVTIPMKPTAMSAAVRKLRKRYEMSDWTPKQVRRTFKTVMSDAGVDIRDLDIWQNHGQRQTVSQRHYLRATHIERKLNVMKEWDSQLSKVL